MQKWRSSDAQSDKCEIVYVALLTEVNGIHCEQRTSICSCVPEPLYSYPTELLKKYELIISKKQFILSKIKR